MTIESRLSDVEESLRLLRDADRLQGRRVSATAPTSNYYLGWNATTKKWEPKGLTLIRKLANQSKTTDTTTAADTVLKFTIGASETWFFEFFIFWQAHVDGNILMTIDVPTGATGRWALGRQQGSASLEPTYVTLAFGTDQGIEVDASSTPRGTIIFGSVLNSTTAGDVEFAWAQLASLATATTVLSASYLKAYQL